MKGELSPMLVQPAETGELAKIANICLGLSSETRAILQKNYSALITQTANVLCKHHENPRSSLNERKFPRIDAVKMIRSSTITQSKISVVTYSRVSKISYMEHGFCRHHSTSRRVPEHRPPLPHLSMYCSF